jgi:hypothetical protein
MWHRWEIKTAYRVLASKTEGRRPSGKTRNEWEHKIKVNIKEIRWGVAAWAGFIRLRIGTSDAFLQTV